MPHVPDRSQRPAPRRALAGAVLMLTLGMAAAGATAQTGTRPQPAQAQSPAGQSPAGQTPAAGKPAQDPVAAHLADVKKQLNITNAQQSQFDQFANVVKQNAQAVEAAMQKAQQNAERSAVESLRTAADFAQTEADNLKRLVPAFETLYSSLSAEQKRLADGLFNAPQDSSQGAPKGKRQG